MYMYIHLISMYQYDIHTTLFSDASAGSLTYIYVYVDRFIGLYMYVKILLKLHVYTHTVKSTYICIQNVAHLFCKMRRGAKSNDLVLVHMYLMALEGKYLHDSTSHLRWVIRSTGYEMAIWCHCT